MSPYSYQTNNGKRYRVAYRTPDGKQHNKGGFKTKTEARFWYRHKMVEIENHGFCDSSRLTFEEVANRWLNDKKHTVEGSTYKKYESECRNHLLPTLGNRIIKDIKVDECQLLVYQWANQLKFFNKLINDAVSIFDLAIKYKLIFDNPFRQVERPKVNDRKKVRSFTNSEFNRFQQGLRKQYKDSNYKAYTFLFVLSHTGLRKGELSALTWNDVDFEHGFLKINKAVTRDFDNHLVIGKTKNVYSVRSVPIGQQTTQVLKKWRLIQQKELYYFNVNSLKPNQLVFTSQHGGILSPSKPGKWMKIIEKNCNLPLYVTPHGLRHTYTGLLIDKGIDVNKVAAILGHKDASITIRIYNDLHPVKDNSIGNVIENL